MNDPMLLKLLVQRAEGGCAFITKATRIKQPNGHVATPGEVEDAIDALKHEMLTELFGACTCSRVLAAELRKPCPLHDRREGENASWSPQCEALMTIRDASICSECGGVGVWASDGCAQCGKRAAQYETEEAAYLAEFGDPKR